MEKIAMSEFGLPASKPHQEWPSAIAAWSSFGRLRWSKYEALSASAHYKPK